MIKIYIHSLCISKKAETNQSLILLSAVVMQEKKQQFAYNSMIFNSYMNSWRNVKEN